MAKVPRLPGFVTYFTQDRIGVPTVPPHSRKQHHAMHERVLLLTLATALTP